MLYKFRSKASGDVVMLQSHGDAMLGYLGREPAAKGIIEVGAMPAALAALERAIAEAEAPQATPEPGAEAEDLPFVARPVGLRQRLWPMVEMLRRCQAEGEPIVWGCEPVKLWSDSWTNGDPIPERYAAGRPDGNGRATFSDNLNPHLAWSDLPAGTKSLVLICHDFDVPGTPEDVNRPGRELAVDLPRVDFFHWVLIDLPPEPAEIAEGSMSRGFTPRGKPGPAVAGDAGLAGARHGLNDYTGWFSGDGEMAGSYFGYDGPFPPWNDSLVHHYVFTLYAVAVPRLPLEGSFDGHAVRRELAARVLGEATFSGTYTLNARLRAA